jgi:cell filamentation protein
MLHPFRHGNGRAQRLFFEQLALHAGYLLEWGNISAEAWISACRSGATGELLPLEQLFAKVVSKIA